MLVVVLMMVGAIAELATVGSLVPFLSLVATPENLSAAPLLSDFLVPLLPEYLDSILIPVALIFITFVLITGSIRLLLAWVSQKFVFRVGHDLGIQVYRTALFKPFAFHASSNSSELVAGIIKTQNVTMMTLLPLLQAATGMLISIALLVALLIIDAEIAISAALGFVIIYGAISYFGRSTLQANGKKIAAAQGQRIQSLQEGLGGIRDVVIDHSQDLYLQKFVKADLAMKDAQHVNTFFGTGPRFVIEAITFILIACFVMFLNGKPGGLLTSLPLLGAFALSGQRLLPALHNIFQSWSQIKSNQQELLDVLSLIDINTGMQPTYLRGTAPLVFNHEIRLTNVTFRYADISKPVLSEADLVINSGSRIGFIGKTGSGKSTIVDLIMGLLEPVSGQISVDNVPLTPDTISNWQDNIAHVAQNVYLADTSIAHNIAFGIPFEEVDFDRVRYAAQKAAILGFIESLPDGFDTLAGERGVRLSGGQKQRIGIARAIYKQANLLVFDEATSALDDETEQEVMDAIQSIDNDKTIIIIAHKPSTVAMCDQVYQVANGKAVLSKPTKQ